MMSNVINTALQDLAVQITYFIFLKRKLQCNAEMVLYLQIEHELDLPWLARVDHLEHRGCIERGEASDIWTGKAWLR